MQPMLTEVYTIRNLFIRIFEQSSYCLTIISDHRDPSCIIDFENNYFKDLSLRSLNVQRRTNTFRTIIGLYKHIVFIY